MQLISWLFIATIALKYNELEKDTFWLHCLYFFSVFLCGIGTTHIYKLILDKYQPQTSSKSAFILSPLIGSIVVGFLFFLLDSLFTTPERVMTKYESFGNYFGLFVDDMWVIMPWFLFFHVVRYSTYKQEMQDRLYAMENMLKIAELDNLKKQLNPHFLFNALNSIKALTIIDSKQAREAINQLSELLRLSLNLGEQQMASLQQEIKLAKDYLSIEKIRYENRLNYCFEVDEELSEEEVIPMSLNTLIENAVKHGIEKIKAGGDILIKIYADQDFIILRVENTGKYDPKPKNSEGGIGLSNLRKRLNYHYGNKAKLEIREESGKVVSILFFPKNK